MTNSTGHTPGKWTTRERQGGRIDVIHEYTTPERGPGQEVAGVAIVSWAGTAEVTDANARLIALAPEMEALLHELVSQSDRVACPICGGSSSDKCADWCAVRRAKALLSSLDQEKTHDAS